MGVLGLGWIMLGWISGDGDGFQRIRDVFWGARAGPWGDKGCVLGDWGWILGDQGWVLGDQGWVSGGSSIQAAASCIGEWLLPGTMSATEGVVMAMPEWAVLWGPG